MIDRWGGNNDLEMRFIIQKIQSITGNTKSERLPRRS